MWPQDIMYVMTDYKHKWLPNLTFMKVRDASHGKKNLKMPPTPPKKPLIYCTAVRLLTFDLHQNRCALHPGPCCVVAVPRLAAVVPRLLWAELGQEQCLALVGQGVLGAACGLGAIVGVLVHLGRHRVVVEEPGHVGKGPPAEPAVESGCGRFWVGTVEVLDVHCHFTSDWDWRGGGSTD